MKMAIVFLVLLVLRAAVANAQATPTPFVPPPTPIATGRPPLINCFVPDNPLGVAVRCCYEWRGSAFPPTAPGEWHFLQCVQ